MMLSLVFLPASSVRADSKIPTLIAQLASDDPRLRQAAVADLMDLKRKDLPQLRAAAISLSPLLPAQIAGLREAVTQVFLAGERFKVNPDDLRGFLGVQFSNFEQLYRADGVTILGCIQGFPAFRYLQPGDVVVGFLDRPEIKLHTSQDFMNAVRRLQPGQIVRLAVVRSGRPLAVAIPLDFRPAEIPDNANEALIDNWVQQRQEKADAYWNGNFSVIDPASASGSSQASTSAEP